MEISLFPKTLFVEITTECNLRCRHCHMWLTTEPDVSLTTVEKKDAISQFAVLNPSGDVVFTGGEPFLRFDQVLELSKHARELRIYSVVNSNGYNLSDRQVDSVVHLGPDLIVFSLDGPTSELHDLVRGVSGSFKHVTRSIQRFVASRGGADNPRIVVSSVLHEKSLPAAMEIVELAKGLGVDGITFQVLEATFFHKGKVDKFHRDHWFTDPLAASNRLDQLLGRYRQDDFFLLSDFDIDSMKMYISHPVELPFSVCGAADSNLVLDMHGNIKFCSYMEEVTGGQTLGNIRTGSLDQILSSGFSQTVQKTLRNCNRSCGMLNCNRKKED